MSKYIDAEKLIAEIERRISDNTFGAKLELIDLLSFIEWLEKEPKGKTNPLFEDCLAEVNPDVRKEVRENIDKMLEKEQKPAEWSEKDEGMLNCIIATLCEESHGGRETNEHMVSWLDNRLKSLRPQQKSIISDTDKSNLKDAPAIIRKSNHPFKENIALIIEKYL